MRIVASSPPVSVKRRAVDPVYTVKIFPVHGEVTKGLKTFWMNLQIEFCIDQNFGLWTKISNWQNADKKREISQIYNDSWHKEVRTIIEEIVKLVSQFLTAWWW
jgi:hypothetical protein